MKKHVLGRLLAVFLSVAMVVSLLNSAGFLGRAQADEDTWTKTVAGLGTSVIKAPTAPTGENSPWTGSYVWYGKYKGTPVKYRVLAPKTYTYGGEMMLLDCDSILYDARFDDDGNPNQGAQNSNEWQYSDLKEGLNGSSFLTKEDGFTALERAAIASSEVSEHELDTGCVIYNDLDELDYDDGYVGYAGLNGEKVFLLDYEDVLNPKYGYILDSGWDSFDEGFFHYVKSRIKNHPLGGTSCWWLRTACTYKNWVGMVDKEGVVYMSPGDEYAVGYVGVSPAFNVELSSIVFSSVVSGTAGKNNAEYKLTLVDDDLTVEIQSDKPVTASGSRIIVPYTITGADASKATQVSVMILDKRYGAVDASIKYYSKLNTGETTGLMTTGTGTFTLPANCALSGWNTSYYVYLLAEDVNGIHETDYASTPLKLAKPKASSSQLKITTQPVDKTLLVGSTAKFTVAATGSGTLQYQWQFRKNSSSAWANSAQSGNKTDTLLVATTAGMHGYQFRCIVTDSTGGKAYSNPATLTLKPRITTQPVDKSLLVGSTAKFTVEATGKATLKYQWQYRKDANSSWANSGQQGAKTDTLLVSTTAGLHGYQFRCIVTDGNGQKSYSRAATLMLKPRIITQPVDKDLLVGSTAKFAIEATGKGTLTYQWQYRKDENASWANSGQQGAKTNTLLVSTTAGLHGYQFRCIVTDGNGQITYSKTVTLTLKPRITMQPAKATTVSAGSTAQIKVEAIGKSTLKYQWQYRKNSSCAWADSAQSGNKTATLSVAATKGLDGYEFRCIVTDGNGRKTISSMATLIVE